MLEAIEANGQDLRNRVDAVVIKVTLLREDQKKLSARVTSEESNLKVLRPSLTTMEETVRSLTNKVQGFRRPLQVEYQCRGWVPGRGRRVRPHPILCGLTGAKRGKGCFITTLPCRTHAQIPGLHATCGNAPRPVLICLLNYRDRETILKKMCSETPLQYKNSWVYLFPDYTVTVQCQWVSFTGVKKRLHQVDLTYSLQFPAILKILANGVSFFFTEPTDACDWVNNADTRYPWRHCRLCARS
ncbi:hypothetical protein NDU88_002995 [Pleurodeles waltl]|uniref:Uncharacterized protein n=1 Tax=Pleurodeles waltl TaxID=8319 RepID=A0AAV7QEI1_PLEWA|nr:hypothetical protein NDU88_002995 [Pleurodeles waltl]